RLRRAMKQPTPAARAPASTPTPKTRMSRKLRRQPGLGPAFSGSPGTSSTSKPAGVGAAGAATGAGVGGAAAGGSGLDSRFFSFFRRRFSAAVGGRSGWLGTPGLGAGGTGGAGFAAGTAPDGGREWPGGTAARAGMATVGGGPSSPPG